MLRCTNKRPLHDLYAIVAAINDFFAAWNENPKPFLWTAIVDSIVAKLAPRPNHGADRLHLPETT